MRYQLSHLYQWRFLGDFGEKVRLEMYINDEEEHLLLTIKKERFRSYTCLFADHRSPPSEAGAQMEPPVCVGSAVLVAGQPGTQHVLLSLLFYSQDRKLQFMIGSLAAQPEEVCPEILSQSVS